MGNLRTRIFAIATALSLVVVLGGLAFLMLRDPPQPDSSLSSGDGVNVEDADGDHDELKDAGRAEPAEATGSAAEEPATEAVEVATDQGPPSLRGTITNIDGEPVESAQVSLLDITRWQATLKREEKSMQGNRHPASAFKHLREVFDREFGDVVKTRSASDGTYAFHDLAANEYRVIVYHEAHLVFADGWAFVQTDSTSELDVELATGYRITGRVVDPKGRPIPEATVLPIPAEEAKQKTMGKLFRTLTTMMDGAFFLGPPPITSDADGRFVIQSVEPIEYVLKTSAQGWLAAETSAAAGQEEVVVELTTGETLTGRVVDSTGTPQADASWEIAPHVDLEMNNPMALMQTDVDLLGEKTQAGKNSEDGSFTIRGLESGEYDLKVRLEGYPDLRTRVDVEGSVQLGDLVIEEARRIEGTVRGPDGSFVGDARVWILEQGGVRGPFGSAGQELAKCRSEPNGTFALESLPSGQFEVHARSREFGETSVKDIEAGQSGVEIRLKAGVTISARVLDASTKNPIPDVKITSPLAPGKDAETDANGEFLIRGIAREKLRSFGSGSGVFVMLRHPDYGQGMENVVAQTERPAQLPQILLKSQTYLPGIVVDPEGEPIAGARVQFEVPGTPAIFSAFNGGGAMEATSTARDGTFDVVLPHGKQLGNLGSMLTLTVRHPRYASTSLPLAEIQSDGSEIEVELRPGTELSGHVRDGDGSPVAGARLQLTVVATGEGNPQMVMFRAMMPASNGPTVYTRKDGSYRFPTLALGDYKLTAGAPEFVSSHLELSILDEAPVTQDVTLSQGGDLEGRVVDPDGRPLAGAEVQLTEPLPPEVEKELHGGARFLRQFAAQGLVSASSEDSGTFRLEGVGEDKYDLIVRKPGYTTSEVRGVSLGHRIDDIVLERLGNIGGRVTNATTGGPITKFHIRVEPEERTPFSPFGNRKEIDDADGQFFFDLVPPGRYTVSVNAEGFAPSGREIQVRSGGYAEANVSLGIGSSVVVDVRDMNGDPIEGATIQPYPQDPQGGGTPWRQPSANRTEDGGSCKLEGLAEGKYGLSVQHPDYFLPGEREALLIELPADEGQVITVELKPAGRLQGQIEGLPPPPSQGHAYYQLELQAEEVAQSLGDQEVSPEVATAVHADDDAVVAPKIRSYSQSVSVDASTGRFNGTSLPPGTYQLKLRRGVYGETTQTPAPPETTDLEKTVTIEAGKTKNVELSLR